MADTNTPTFQPGEVVQLKSGGILMTVLATTNVNSGVIVFYADEKGIPQQRVHPLPAILLKKVDPSQ